MSQLPALFCDVHCRGTCQRCTDVVPARTSTLTTATCVAKCFHGCCTTLASRAQAWASGDYLYYHHHLVTPHCTQFTLPRRWAAPRACNKGYLPRLSNIFACSLLSTDRRATTVQNPIGRVVLHRQSLERRLAVFGSGLLTAMSIDC